MSHKRCSRYHWIQKSTTLFYHTKYDTASVRHIFYNDQQLEKMKKGPRKKTEDTRVQSRSHEPRKNKAGKIEEKTQPCRVLRIIDLSSSWFPWLCSLASDCGKCTLAG
jgi:hypothetical protein